jgi:hypothetical protein
MDRLDHICERKRQNTVLLKYLLAMPQELGLSEAAREQKWSNDVTLAFLRGDQVPSQGGTEAGPGLKIAATQRLADNVGAVEKDASPKSILACPTGVCSFELGPRGQRNEGLAFIKDKNEISTLTNNQIGLVRTKQEDECRREGPKLREESRDDGVRKVCERCICCREYQLQLKRLAKVLHRNARLHLCDCLLSSRALWTKRCC